MPKSTILFAASTAVSCLAIALAGVALTRDGSSASDHNTGARDSATRVAALNERLSTLEDRLGEVLSARAGHSSVPAKQEAESSPVTREPTDGTTEDTDDGNDDGVVDLASLSGRLEAIETRLRGLEEDPVERGYTYLQSDSADLRRQGILALERFAAKDPEAIAAIREMLTDPNAEVRRTTLDTLADLEDKASAGNAVPLLDDEDASVRREAVLTLARLGHAEAGADIAGLLTDPDASVRERAADALGNLKFRGADDQLLRALDDSNGRVRGEVISSLGEAGVKAAAPRLRALYDDNPGDQRYRLAITLRRLGDTAPFEAEVSRLSSSALEHESASQRRGSIRTLAWLARDESKEVFQRALEDSSSQVREEAQRALRSERSYRR